MLTKYLNFALNGIFKRAPVQVTLFVTSRCNIRCKMCFYWEPIEIKSTNELTLAEIEKISNNMPRFFWLLIGGGEPFVRKDLPNIIQCFYANNGIRHVSIPTNGTFPDITAKKVEEILTLCPGLFLNLNLSLNGIKHAHDALCQSEGVFEQVIDTYERLKKVKARFGNLGLGINITHSRYNQNDLATLIDFIPEQLSEVDNISLGLVRGRPKDTSALDVDISYYKLSVEKIESLVVQRRLKNFRVLFGGLAFIKDMLMRRVIARTVMSGWQIPCFAGKISLVIDEKANVYPCEMLPAVGNLRETNYELKKILSGTSLANAVERIRSERCFCTHECAYSTNVLFNPRLWPIMAFSYGKLWLKRLMRSESFGSFDDLKIPITRISRQYNGQKGELYAGKSFGRLDPEEKIYTPTRPF